MTVPRPPGGKRPRCKGRSAVTNGTRLYLAPVDGRREEARRFADLLAEVEAEHGGPERMSVALRAAARAFAQMCVEREVMEMQRARGEAIDVEVYGQLCDRIDRQARRLVPPKDVKPKHDLRDYLSRRTKA